MISVFDTQPVILEEKDGHVLTRSAETVCCIKTAMGKF